MEVQIKSLVIPTHLTEIKHRVGWGNGYIGVPECHPWYGLEEDALYSEYDIQVHGGITYIGPNAPNQEPDGYWWIGFDTAHWGDSPTSCPKSYVEAETNRLYQQAWTHMPAPREETDHRELDSDL